MKKEILKENYADKVNVLVIDDDERIRDLVARYLNEKGYIAMVAGSAEEAAGFLKLYSFDILIVDVMMPGDSGVEFTQSLRVQGNQTPVILLTAMGEVEDRILGLEAGADDYIPKPFDPRELVLRIDAVIKRVPKENSKITKVQIGQWQFDIDHPELFDGQTRIALTNVEANLLQILMQTPGDVVSRDYLSQQCNLDPNKRTIDVQVTRLRRKLEEDSNRPRYLQTVRGQGYLLRAEIMEE